VAKLRGELRCIVAVTVEGAVANVGIGLKPRDYTLVLAEVPHPNASSMLFPLAKAWQRRGR